MYEYCYWPVLKRLKVFGAGLPQENSDLNALNEKTAFQFSGFGQTGPYRDRGGFDLVAQAMSGMISITGAPGQPPVKVGVPIADLNAGIYACYAILAAYIHRLKTGQGQRIDTSLLEASLAYTFWESAIFFATGENPPLMGSAHRLSAPYQVFKAANGHFALGAANQANWYKLCDAIGRPGLLDDPRGSFVVMPARRSRIRSSSCLYSSRPLYILRELCYQEGAW